MYWRPPVGPATFAEGTFCQTQRAIICQLVRLSVPLLFSSILRLRQELSPSSRRCAVAITGPDNKDFRYKADEQSTRGKMIHRRVMTDPFQRRGPCREAGPSLKAKPSDPSI